MLNTEFGARNEVVCDLYADTGDARWLALSYKFEHRAFLEPLERHEDDLAGTHANTQIPKILGSAARFLYTGTPADLLAAGFFWDRVVQHHSFSSGGHGKDEYFGPADEPSDWHDGRTAPTCNWQGKPTSPRGKLRSWRCASRRRSNSRWRCAVPIGPAKDSG